MRGLKQTAGLARSLVIYYSRPHRIGRFANFYGQFIRKGDVAFDIGGHVGNRSLALARAGARVVTLEPQPIFYGFLRRTMPASVTVLPCAAGPAASRSEMAVSSLHPTVSSLNLALGEQLRADSGFSGVSWDRTETVEVTTLDILIERYGLPAFTKIDVEGFEDEVLAGLTQPLPALAIEYLPSLPDVARRCVERLEALGPYEYNLIVGERPRFAAADWYTAHQLIEMLETAAVSGKSGDIYARTSKARP